MAKVKTFWTATETKDGWKVSLSIGGKNYRVRDVLLKSLTEVKKVMLSEVEFIPLPKVKKVK